MAGISVGAPPPNFGSAQGWNSDPVMSIELTISCRKLIDSDVFSKSDPMVVMYMQGLGSKEWREFGRTEVIWNNLNPDFVKKFVVDYFFEERQALRFDVYDVDSNSHNLSKHDFLGRAFCSLGEIVGARSSKLEASLTGTNTPNRGKIIIKAEELDSSKDVLFMKFNGRKLDKKDLFGKSDPFMVFYRCNEDNSYTVCHKTEVIKNTLNPDWKLMEVPVRNICNGDHDRTIKVEVYDWDRDGGHDLIGTFQTSVSKLLRGPGVDNVYECINQKKKAKKKKYKNSGMVNLLSIQMQKVASFLDYIRGGTELCFVVAIDFTASNGNPQQPSSLHYINPNQPNQYSLAIQAVGNIIQDYDTDKLFPTYGFGARLPPDGRVSHNFAVNFNPGNPDCFGIQGIMEAYQRCIRSVQLYGPTNFSPIINSVSQMATASAGMGSKYYVLLMITDGVISDMDATKEAIVNAARLPISIIIIGVGQAEFDAMEELDGDEVRVSYRGMPAERDIVQFVPFRDYISQHGGQVMSQARLAKDVLAEVPDQLLGYMKSRGIKPSPPPPTYTPTAPPPSY
ncbi:copine-8-like [Clavelina lepadiformis]|uniref:copine-8-like n=1 Tax=Clavelina lepadiformis TaxID=159417 RepID=UPI004041EC48